MDTLFSITNLHCGYNSGGTVLEVPHLEIPKGKLVFIVGISGGGKSTLLETLGMMNRTIKEHDVLDIHLSAGRKISLSKLWDGDREALDTFRKKNYSFIFQKTNLIPNFTCGENMILPALFKGGEYKEVIRKVAEYMEMLGLEDDVFDKHIMEVSGGQRQRLSFIRAMVADFTVLFGDEPTGNLDTNTAKDVFGALASYLKNSHGSGIVVSHDINLANEFGDVIIPITTKDVGGNKFGVIEEKNVMYRKSSNLFADSRKEYSDLVSHLKELIT